MQLPSLNKLQSKVAIGLLLVSLLPLGIVGFFGVRTADEIIESIVGNQLENLAADKQQLLQRWLNERKADLEVVAASPAVKNLDPTEIAPYLELVRQQYQVYQRFVVAARDGRTVYDGKVSDSKDWTEALWFQRALEGKRFMSDVMLDTENNDAVFLLSAPIFDPTEKFQGAVCATVSTAAIRRDVLQVSLGTTGECYLVDQMGKFLAHKNMHRVLRENIAQSGSFTNIFRNEKRPPVYRDYRNISVLGASRSIPDTSWYLVVEQDEAEAFATAYRLRRQVGAALGVTIFGVIGFSILLAYYVTRPLRALHSAAQSLGIGNFDDALIQLPKPRGDEIGTLRNAFEQMSHQLRDRQSRLENRVDVTDRELQETDLRLKNVIAAAARSEHLAALGRLSSGVAHEIRTPLTALKLYLQSAQDDFSISREHAEDFDMAMRQVVRIESTINHFLNFAKPQEPVMAAVDIPKIIEDALIVVRPRAVHQGVEIQTSIATDLPRVEGDMRQLGEALVNLLINALEEMPNGGNLRITVESHGGATEAILQDAVLIDVTDNGPGIKSENVDLLFEPFFTTKASGSGLGLSIVQGTVQLHGGYIRVRTEIGRGTTFSIFLPGVNQGDRS
jgi:two-component system, NtrC family, sensor kinase